MAFWTRSSSPTYPPAPAGTVIHVVGDIHGRYDLLRGAFAMIDRDSHGPGTHIEVYLGDYVDRGPDSAKVMSALYGRRALRNTVMLLGNHEEMFVNVLHDGTGLKTWLSRGGLQTALSYGLTVDEIRNAAPADLAHRLRAAVPDDHYDVIGAMVRSYRCGGYMFVHAGIRPGVPLDAQSPADLMWIREPFLSDRRDHGAIIVHGHTICETPEFRTNRINLDSGAHISNQLSCIRIDENGVHLLRFLAGTPAVRREDEDHLPVPDPRDV